MEMGGVASEHGRQKRKKYGGSLNMNVTQMFGVTVASMGSSIQRI